MLSRLEIQCFVVLPSEHAHLKNELVAGIHIYAFNCILIVVLIHESWRELS
jgi:hypothetical protein